MKYMAILALVGLLLLAGCAKSGIQVVAPEDTAAQASAPSGEPTELTGDMAALEEDTPIEDINIDTAELEELDM